MNHKTTCMNRGFALIETTTVLSIIAILIGLLIPILQPVREQTNSQRARAYLQSQCQNGQAQGYVIKDLIVSSFSDGYTFRTNPNAKTLIAEPAHPGRTASTTITMQYAPGCPFTESVTPRSNTERQKMYTDLLVGAAGIAGVMVNGQSGNDLLALHNALTGPNALTVGPELRDAAGNSASFQSILNPNAVLGGHEMWLAAIEMVTSVMRLGAAGENYSTMPSIAIPTAPTGTQLFSHSGMLNLVNAITDGTSNTLLLADVAALQQNPTPTARNAFVQHVNQALQSGKITVQESDALTGMMGIVY